MKKRWIITLGITMLISLVSPTVSYGMETDKQKKEYFLYLKDVLPKDVQQRIQQLMIEDVIGFLSWQAITLEGHTGEVKVGVNGNKVATAANDAIVRVWDLNTGELLYTFHEDIHSISSVAMNDDKVVTGSKDGTIDIWDLKTKQLQRTFQGHINVIRAIAIHNGKVATASYDGFAKIWDIDTGQLLYTLGGHTEWLSSVAMNNDKVATGSWDDTAKVWDLSTGQLLHTIEGHARTISSVAMNDDKIVIGSYDNSAKIWSLKTYQLLHILEGHKGTVSSVAISGNKVVTGSFDGTAKIWNLITGQLLYTLRTGKVYSVAMIDDKVVTGLDNVVKIWSYKPNLQGTPDTNPFLWIIYNVTVLQAHLINRAYKAIIAGQDFKLDSKDLQLFLSFPQNVQRYLVDKLNIRRLENLNKGKK